MATSGEAATSLMLPYTLRDVAIWKHLEHFKVLVRSQSLRVCKKHARVRQLIKGE